MSALLSVSGLRASPSSQSGSAGRGSHDEAAVFIICREAPLPALTALILEGAQPHTLAGGHEAYRPLSLKEYPHVPLSSEDHTATLQLSKGTKMSLASRMREKFRNRLARLVEKERAAAGCAKKAMANVSSKVGLSVISIYRIVNNHPKAVRIDPHHYAELLMHSLGIVKAAASRMKSRRHATSIHA